MAVDRKEIDLIIRAALQGKNTLPAVTKAIAEIEKAIDAQAAAAKRGETSIDELKASLAALQQVQDRLKDQAGLISQFNKLGEQIAKTEDKSRKAAQAELALREQLDATGSATVRQTERLANLSAATDRTIAAVSRQRTEQQAYKAVLTEAGIEVNNLSSSETKLRQSAAQVGLAINKTQKAISSYAADVRMARDAERALAETQAFEKAAADSAKLVKAQDYVQFWTTALNQADVAEKKLATNNALRQIADEAVAGSRGYLTLASSMKAVQAPGTSLKQTIQDILDPSRQVRNTLSGVESQVGTLETAIRAIRGPVVDYLQQVKELSQAQRSIAGQAALVEQYQQQVAAVRAARTEFSQARSEVLNYANAVREAGERNQELEGKLRTAQARLDAAAGALQKETAQARLAKTELQQAGIATNNLAEEQRRLLEAARSATGALRDLTAAEQKYGRATVEASTASTLFNTSGRTTLSLAQRFKGELLSVAASYIGIYGAVTQANKVIEVFNSRQGIQNQLALSVGNDPRAIAEEYDYLRKQADRLGISFEGLANGYAKFSAAATLAGRSRAEIRYIFETFAEVGRVANLSKENLDGVFKALEQIISKGTIQAEELRGQLGDRLFGAFQVAADALKDQFPDLSSALKGGLVTSDQLVKIATKYKEIVADQLPAAMQSLAADQERLNSQLFDFKLLIADSGFADSYKKLVSDLTTFFKSNDGQRFAEGIGSAFSALADALLFVLNNLDAIYRVTRLLAEIYTAKFLFGAIQSTIALTVKLGTLAVATDAVSVANRRLLKSFVVLAALLATYEGFSYLIEKFAPVRNFTFTVIALFRKLYTYITDGSDAALKSMIAGFASAFASIMNAASAFLQKYLAFLESAARKIGLSSLGDLYASARAKITVSAQVDPRAVTEAKQAVDRLKSELERIDDETVAAIVESNREGATGVKPGAKESASPTPTASTTKTDAQVAAEEKAAAKRLKIRESLESALRTIEAKIERNEKDNLESRIAAIDTTYTTLLKKIRAFGGAEAQGLEARLNTAVNDLKLQETKKFNDALLKEQEQLQSKIESAEAAGGRKSKEDLDRRLEAIRTSYADTYRDIAALRAKLADNGRSTAPADALQGRLDAGIVDLQNQERRKFITDEIARQEKQVNDLLATRSSRIEAITNQQKVGLITSEQARQQSVALVQELQPQIESLAAEALKFAAGVQGAVDPALLARFVATITGARASAKDFNFELFTAQSLSQMLANGATNAFDGAAEAIGGAIAGTNSWADAIENTRTAFLKFAADFLRQIATMILQRALLNALESAGSGGGFLGKAAGFLNGLVQHSGGVVGQTTRTRSAPMGWFANAPRYHNGGMPGLAADEYATILQKNEEVLSADNPRNIMNGGSAASAAPAASRAQDIKIVNMIDSGSVINAGLSTPEGTKAILNFVRANRSAMKTVLG